VARGERCGGAGASALEGRVRSGMAEEAPAHQRCWQVRREEGARCRAPCSAPRSSAVSRSR